MKTHVVKASPDMSLAEAVDLMDLYQVSGLPVVDGEGRLCGMLTESDVIRAIFTSKNDQHSDGAQDRGGRVGIARLRAAREAGVRRVGEWMTIPAVSISETASVMDAATTMFEAHLKRLPVVDDLGRVIGVLNRIDVCQALFEGDLAP